MFLSDRHTQTRWPLASPPKATRVVLGARDDSVALVVEGAAEYFVGVAFEDLLAFAGQRVPQSGSFVGAGGHYSSALRIECDLSKHTHLKTFIYKLK